MLRFGAARGMEPHFHAWLRSGRIFSMVAQPFADRTTAPSKRRPPRWATVARAVAAAVGAEPAAVRAALAGALAAERQR